MAEHRMTRYGTTMCPVEGVQTDAAEGECSACGSGDIVIEGPGILDLGYAEWAALVARLDEPPVHKPRLAALLAEKPKWDKEAP